MQCVELGQLPALPAAAATTQMRHRTSATRIRKRHSRRSQHRLLAEATTVAPSSMETETPAMPPTATRRTTCSSIGSSTGSPKLTLTLSAAAALAAAAMLHTTYAAASDALALPLHGTATPLHELNATLPSSSSSSISTAAGTALLNESRAHLDAAAAAAAGSDADNDVEHWFDSVFLVLKAFVMLFIIIAAICGNLLVIISVMRVRKLRCVYVM